MRFGIAGNLDKTELPEVVERLITRFKRKKCRTFFMRRWQKDCVER